MNAIVKIAYSDGIDLNYLLTMANRASYCYKDYKIPKANGGTRQIYHPSRRLKAIQRWLSKRLLEHFEIHQSATAYKKGSNIRFNAKLHKASNYLLRMDFSNFFESITTRDFTKRMGPSTHINGITFDDDDLYMLCNLLFRHGRLTIGAPSSPIISNMLMYNFDQTIYLKCKEFDVVYSRYADDLFFSTKAPNILSNIEKFVYDTVKDIDLPESLKINEAKTRHTSKKGKRSITGLTITSVGEISIGRAKKREIRSYIHKTLHGQKTAIKPETLLGMIAYIMDVEPSLFQSLEKKYGPGFLEKIKHKADYTQT